MIQDNHCTLIAFIDDWLKTKKKLEVKEATYRRLLISFRTLKGSDIASVRLCDLDSVYMRLSQNSQPNSDTPDMNSRKER